MRRINSTLPYPTQNGFFSVLGKRSLLLLTALLTTTAGCFQSDGFDENIHEAKSLIAEAGDLSSLTVYRPVMDASTGLERRDLPEERLARMKAIEAYLAAAGTLDRALQIRPEDPDALRMRIEVGRTIGKMALQGRDFLLARSYFRRLEQFGISKSETELLVRQVETARTAPLQWRAARLRHILQDLTQGLSRKGRPQGSPLLEDYLFEAVRYRELQTVEILASDLQRLIRKAKKDGQEVSWTHSERDRATFICQVLSRLGFSESIEPLGEWMAVVTDHALAVAAGRALCNTRKPTALPYLNAARDRLGINSPTWKQIQPYVNRIPK